MCECNMDHDGKINKLCSSHIKHYIEISEVMSGEQKATTILEKQLKDALNNYNLIAKTLLEYEDKFTRADDIITRLQTKLKEALKDNRRYINQNLLDRWEARETNFS